MRQAALCKFSDRRKCESRPGTGLSKVVDQYVQKSYAEWEIERDRALGRDGLPRWPRAGGLRSASLGEDWLADVANPFCAL